MTEWLWAYLAVGAAVGFLSGLFGIGGGSVIVPALAFIFAAKGFPATDVVHIALGTAVATILFTSVSSVRSHHARGAVNWRAFRAIAPGILVGTFGGALLAGVLNVRVLSVIFTLFIFYVGAQMLRPSKPHPTRSVTGMREASAFGVLVGVLSSLTATGGAAFVVAYLVRRNLSVHDAIGTAAAVGWPLAAAGTAGYVVGGWHASALPEYSIGYVYLPALAGIAVSSVLTAPIGAAVAHRTPAPRLKKSFAFVLFALATSMLVKFF